LAAAIVEAARHRWNLRVQRVVPIPTSEYPLPAPRPPWAVLDCGKIAAAFGIVPRPWRKGLEHMLEQLLLSGF
jgi:dTDP-4-dehydrorhamnose reductase